MAGYEWDVEKDVRNLNKHGVSFAEACTVFEGPVLTSEDEGAGDEMRERSYGLLRGNTVLCVIHTSRGEAIRIISARKATPQERELFHAYLRKACR